MILCQILGGKAIKLPLIYLASETFMVNLPNPMVLFPSGYNIFPKAVGFVPFLAGKDRVSSFKKDPQRIDASSGY